MGAKHRITGVPEQRQPSTEPNARRAMSGIAGLCDIVSAAMLCAAAMTALVINVHPGKPLVEADQAAPPVAQPVRQEGTVIGVSANSVTARSANGYTQTYIVTPNTTVVTRSGSQSAPTPSHFEINDRIDIVGTLRGGTATATAVADRDAGHGDGPPMDFVADQPVNAAPSA